LLREKVLLGFGQKGYKQAVEHFEGFVEADHETGG
jgi:hypothetical protein